MKNHQHAHSLLRRALSTALAAALALGLAPAPLPGMLTDVLPEALSDALSGALAPGAALASLEEPLNEDALVAYAEPATVAAAPYLQLDPADSTYAKNAVARFYVRAMSVDGGYLSYQWHVAEAPDNSGPPSEGEPIDGATSSVLTTKTPDKPGIYYYWAVIKNTVNVGTESEASATVTSAKAKAKIVDRELPDHITNGDFSTLYAPNGQGTIYWSNAGTNTNGWYTIAAQSRLPNWKTTDFNDDSPSSNITHFGDVRQSFQVFGLNLKPFGYYAASDADAVAEPANPQAVPASPATGKSDSTSSPNMVQYTRHGDNGGDTGHFGAIELANARPSSVYQEVATVPGKIYEWSLDHIKRISDQAGNDVMAVVIGSAINEQGDLGDDKNLWENDGVAELHYPYGASSSGYPQTTPTYFYKIVTALAARIGAGTPDKLTSYGGQSFTQEYNGHTYYVYIASTGASWKTYAGSYTVPAGQGTTVFSFVGIYPTGSTGNVLDNIAFASGSPVQAEQEISYTGETKLSIDTRSGFAYALAELRGSSVIARQGLDARYDTDGAGSSPEAAISPNPALGNGVSWYFGGSINDAGSLTFYGLTPGATYRVIGIPGATVSEALGTNISPADVLDEGYYADVKILPAKDDDNGGTVAAVTAGLAGDGETAFVTVENSLSRAEYALLPALEPGGSTPDTANPAKAWTSGGGELRFTGLAPGTVYFLVVRPLGYDEIGYADAAWDGESLLAQRIATPKAGQDLAPAQVGRAPGGEAILIKEARAGYGYAIVNPDSGAILMSQNADAEGAEIEFSGLDPAAHYRAVTKPPSGGYMKGVRVWPYPGELEIDYVHDRARAADGGYIPANVETSFDGGASWTPGTGSDYLDLSAALAAAAGTVTYRLSAGGFADARVQPTLALDFPTRPAAPDADAYAFNYAAERIENTSDAALEIRAGAAGAWHPLADDEGDGEGFTALGWTETAARRVYLRFPASQADGSFASAVLDMTIPARPAAPDGLVAAATVSDTISVSGLNTSAAYLYRRNGIVEYTTVSAQNAGAVADLPFATGESYEFRLAATDSLPMSRPATVKPEPISFGAVDFGEFVYGVAILERPVSVRNTDAEQVDGVTFAIEDDDADIFELTATGSIDVPGSSRTDLLSVRIADGATNPLPAGRYNATIVARYGDGKTYSAGVSLSVEKAGWDMDSLTATPSGVTESGFKLSLVNAPTGAELEWRFGDTVVYPSVAGNVYTFTDLAARTAYAVGVRALGDANHNDSAIVTFDSVRTAMPAPAAGVARINYDSERLEFADGTDHGDSIAPGNYSVTVAGAAFNVGAQTAVANGGSVTPWADSDFTVSVVRNGAGGFPDSVPASFPVKGRADAAGFEKYAASTDISSDGAITCAGNFQYRVHIDGGSGGEWTDATNRASVRIGRYDARNKATAVAFASKPTVVEIGSLSLAVDVVSVTAKNGTLGTADTTALEVEFNRAVVGFGASSVSFEDVTANEFLIDSVTSQSVESGTWTINIHANPAVPATAGTVSLTVAIASWGDSAGHNYTVMQGSPATVTVCRAFPEPTPEAQIDFVNERLANLDANAGYMIDGAPVTATGGTVPIEASWMDGEQHSIVKVGGGARVNSAAQQLLIPKRPAAPAGTVADPPAAGGNGTITITDAINDKTYEYRLLSAGAWQEVGPAVGNSLAITNLAPGAYAVRAQAAIGVSFASAASSFHVHAFNEVDFGGVYVGYEVGGVADAPNTPSNVSPRTVTADADSPITGVEWATGDGGSVLGTPPTEFTLSGSNANWTVKPNEGLQPKQPAAPYVAWIKIRYQDSSFSYEKVSLLVHPRAEIASVAASSTEDKSEHSYHGLTDQLTITFERPIDLAFGDVTVSGGAIKDADKPNLTDVSNDKTAYTLAVVPASMANKTGDPITVSVNVGSVNLSDDYYFQIANGESLLQNSQATVTIPRAIETASAVAVMDGYSTSYIQFTLMRKDGHDNIFYPIASAAIAEDAMGGGYSGIVKIEYTDSSGDISEIIPTSVVQIDADLDYTFRVTFIPPKSGNVRISVPDFAVEAYSVAPSVIKKDAHFSAYAYLLDSSGRNVLTDLADAHQAVSLTYANSHSEVLVAPAYTLGLDKEYADWTVSDLHIHADSLAAEPIQLEAGKGYTVTGGGTKPYYIDGVVQTNLTNQLQIALAPGWTAGNGTYWLHAALRRKSDGALAPLAVKITLSGITPSWLLTVDGGTGAGRYPAGRSVAIAAPPENGAGEVFFEWSATPDAGAPGAFLDRRAASTRYTTTASNATLKPDYKMIPPAPSAAIDYANERLTGLGNGAEYNYALESGARGVFTSSPAGEYAFPAGDAWLPAVGEQILTLTAAAATTPESLPQTLIFPARGGSPGAVGIAETYSGLADGRLADVTDAMEYRAASAPASQWTAVPQGAGEVAGLAPGTYYVRYKASASGHTFASQIASATIDASAETPIWGASLSPASAAIPQAAYGYAAGGAAGSVTVTVANTGNQPTGELAVTLSGGNVGAFALQGAALASIEPGGAGSFAVAPVAGLDAGHYSAMVTVSGAHDISKTFGVSFEVVPAEIIGFEAPAPFVAGQWDALPAEYATAAGVSGYLSLQPEYQTATALYAGGSVALPVAAWDNEAGDYAPWGGESDRGAYAFVGTLDAGALGSNFANSRGLRPAISVIIHNVDYDVELDASGFAFPNAQYGYAPEWKQVSVANAGMADAGELALSLDSPDFVFDNGSQSAALIGVRAGAPGAFAVAPAAGLAPGLYGAEVTVAAGGAENAGLIPRRYSLSFAVTEAALTGFEPAEIDGGVALYAPRFASVEAAEAYLNENCGTVFAATAHEGAVPVSAAGWSAAGAYDAGAPGRYAFVAALGALPAGYANPHGYAATAEVVVRAPVNAQAPRIVTNPAAISGGFVGAEYALSIVAESRDGGTLAYQWYTGSPAEHGAGGGTAIPGANGASYAAPAEQAAPGTLNYWCAVTNTNSGATGEKTVRSVSAIAPVTLRYAALTVKNGTISDGQHGGQSAGAFAAGATVAVAADAPGSGQRFRNWTQTAGPSVALPAGISGTIKMPAGDVAIEAAYIAEQDTSSPADSPNSGGAAAPSIPPAGTEAGAGANAGAGAAGAGDGTGAGDGAGSGEVTADNGKVTLEYAEDGGNVTISLPADKVSEIIGNGAGGAASFDASRAEGAHSVTFTPKSGLSDIADGGLKITVIFPRGAVTLDGGAVRSLVAQARGPELTFEVKELASRELTAAQAAALARVSGSAGAQGAASAQASASAGAQGTAATAQDSGSAGAQAASSARGAATARVTATARASGRAQALETFDISVYSGGEQIHSYAGELAVTLPYSGRVPVAVWYVADDGRLERQPSTYSARDREVSFRPAHLSLYAVGYDGFAFEDVAEADWFFGDVEYVYGAGLMDGTAETLFSPGLAMTRGMMVTVLGRCAGASASAASYSGRGAFVDVDAGAWYAPYVEWARESGIAAGVGDGRFDPDGSITRQDLAALLHRYAEKTGAALPEARSYAAFGDEAGIAGYARAAVEALHRAGVVSGKPGNAFDPAGTATRAEVAAMLHRFLEAAK